MLLAIALFPQVANTQESSSLTSAKFIRAKKPIQNSYIVVFNDLNLSTQSIQSTANELVKEQGEIRFLYKSAIKGFAVRLSEAQALALSQDERVKYVEEDSEVSINAVQSNPPSWGVDRIDQVSLPLDNSYNYNNNGANVNAYVIDSGVLTTHSDFGGRAEAAYDAVNDGNGSTDCNGHGTHVAGTIGGNTYGVAKGVRLFSVRVLGCSNTGAISNVIAGVDWVTANHVKPAVANMSLGGTANNSLDNAVRNSISAGVTYVVAAGNAGQDASQYSPARVTEALTVGAIDINDNRASFSNIGSTLDVFAPGENITSTWNNGGTNSQSGTSMASPHVAGVAALYLQSNPTASPTTVNSVIIQTATLNSVINPGTGSPNRLLYSQLFASPINIIPIIQFLLSDSIPLPK